MSDQFHDARILCPFDPEDERYRQPFVWSIGANAKSKNWKQAPSTPTIADCISRLARHPVNGKKDGLAFVPGEMVPGDRLKSAVIALHAVVLDLDKGTDPERLDAGMKATGKLALRYTSFSNGKTSTEFRRDDVRKFADGKMIDTALMRRFVLDKCGWDSAIAGTVEFVSADRHTKEGVTVEVSHAAMPKNRIVLPLKEAFRIADFQTLKDAEDSWRKIVFASADLLGVADAIDRTGGDLNRLFYFPRHAEGADWSVTLCGGDLLDWRALELENKWLVAAAEVEGANKGAKSKTKEGRALGQWSRKHATGFQIADAIRDHCPERIRGNGGVGIEIECPNASAHSEPDNPEDRACLAINAGEGRSEIFTVSCRHDSCQGLTALDMLGAMLKDEWFSREVIDSDDYNELGEGHASAITDNSKAEAGQKAEETYQEAIEGLTPDSAPEAIEKVAKIMVAASLPPVPLERAISAMAKALDVKPTTIKTTLKAARLALQEREFAAGATTDKTGRVTFAYKGEFNFDEAADVCSKALLAKNGRNKVPTFSQISGNAVRLDVREGRAEFVEMTQTSLWSELNNLVTFVRRGDSADGARQPVDRYVATHVYEQAYNTMPPAPEVLYTPLYLKGGGLLLTEKYHFDPKQGLNYLLLLNDLKVPPVPPHPTTEDMGESLNWIRTELLADFPFRDTDLDGKERREPAEANALAMLITPFMRRMIQGRTPLFFVTKPQAGTGGTLLASLPMKLFDGVTGDDASMSYTPSEEEMEKRLIAAIMGTRTHLFFDDVKEFNNRVLLRALTSPRVGGRVLGHSRIFERDNNYNWVASGNNPNIGEEMRRRTCWIRLNAQKADVAGRAFRHPDKSGMQFNEFVERNRGLAIRHILTLIEYWQEQGAEEFTGRRLSGFDDWSKKVGGVLAACGVEGFLNTRAPAALDMEQSSENELLRLWLAKYQTTFLSAADLYIWASDTELSVLSGRDDEARRSNFIRTLRGLEGRAFEVEGKTYAIRAAQDVNKVTTFGIEHVEKNA